MSSRGGGDSGACRWEDVTSRMQQGYEQDCFAAPWLSCQDLYSPAVAPLHDLRQKKCLLESRLKKPNFPVGGICEVGATRKACKNYTLFLWQS